MAAAPTAAERHTATQSSTDPEDALALIDVVARDNAINVDIEFLIGVAIEMASFLVL